MIKRSNDLLAAMQHLRFRQLYALLVLQEVGSIVRGAERLFLTQPALTKMLRDIEEMVGQKLFQRTNRGVIQHPREKCCAAMPGASLPDCAILRRICTQSAAD